MGISDLPDQRTPGQGIELTFQSQTTPPNPTQNVILLGHVAATGLAASGLYVGNLFVNSGDTSIGLVNAVAECVTRFGNSTCELAKMILAAITANQATNQFPQLWWVALASTDTDFGGGTNLGLNALNKLEAEFVVSPYEGATGGTTLSATAIALNAACKTISGPSNVQNNQFGSIGVIFNRSQSNPALLPIIDSQYLAPCWLYDSGTLGASVLSIAEMASYYAAIMAGNAVPFNPLDDQIINGVPAPLNPIDWPTVGLGMATEAALNRGWGPLKVFPNGSVAVVRAITARLTITGNGNGLNNITAYYDVQDFQTLYFWRKTLFTRFAQPDWKQRKASAEGGKLMKSEMIRLATLFQDQQMFQAVDQLSSQFVVQRDVSDRSRFNYFTPVNVIPGLHVIDGNIQATTQFDQLSF